MTRHLARWLTPTGFVLAGLCFALPFVTVSCDAPGGYGRSAPGGTTTYTGFDLVTGDEPAVDPEHVRPAAEQREDRLDPQPLAIAALLLIAAGAVTAAVRDARLRRATAAALAAGAAVFLVANQGTAEAIIAERLQAQLTTPLPAGKEAADYVQTNPGFLAGALLLGVLAVGNLVARLTRRRSAEPVAGASQREPG